MRPARALETARRERPWHAASAALLVVLVVLVGTTFTDYGVTADEGVQHRYGRRIVRWYATGGRDTSATEANNLFLYGGAFELAAQAAESVSPIGVYDTRHLVNAAFGLGGIVAAWGLGRALGGAPAGFLSALFLALTPQYYGHCFANPKDVPFAALYALAAWSILGATGSRLRPLSPRIAAAGVVVGVCAGIRVSGIALVGFAGLLWGTSAWAEGRGRGEGRREALSVLLSLAVVSAIAWGVMLACWPWAQLDPVRHPALAMSEFSDFRGNPVFFEGAFVAASELPRTYVPRLFALTLPEFYFAALALGVAALTAAGFAVAAARRLLVHRVTWLAALALVPLGWTVLDRTPLYNGVRHLLFVVPLLAVLAGASVVAAARSRLPRAVLGGGLAAVAACAVLAGVDMAHLHPYQYVYFNRVVAGGLASAVTRYESDYWSASYKEGIEWTCRHYSRRPLQEPVRVGGDVLVPFAHYLTRDPCAAPFFTAVAPEQDPHVLLVSVARRAEIDPRARLLHTVERLGAPLLHVYELRPPR